MKQGIDYIGVGCGALILNEKEEILLMKRSSKCKNQHGYWQIPGGSVEFNETFQDAIKREVEEELGIEIEVGELLTLCNDIMPEEKQHWVTPQFLCKIKSGNIINKEPEKCEEIKWLPFHQLPEPQTIPLIEAVKAYKKKYQ